IAVRGSRRRAGSRSNGMSAGVAELGRSREDRPTVRADPGQRGRALFAEARPLRVVVLAPGTLHKHPPGAGRGSDLAAIVRGLGAGQTTGRACGPVIYPSPVVSASAFSSQYVMSIARYIAVAVARCSWACWRSSGPGTRVKDLEHLRDRDVPEELRAEL